MPHVLSNTTSKHRRLLALLLSLAVAFAGVVLAPAAHAARPDAPASFDVSAADGGANVSLLYFTEPDPPISKIEISVATDANSTNFVSREFSTDGFGTYNIAIDNLTNGTTYYIRARVFNADGFVDAPAGAGFTREVTPDAPPLAPTIGTATAGNGTASVTFTPPADNGTSAITGYTAVSDPGGLASEGCTESPCTVAGLTNGVTYTFTVTASNSSPAVQSPPSEPSNAVVPKGPPFAPRSIARAGATPVSATVSFLQPVFSGVNVSGYQVSSDNGRSWRTVATRLSGVRRLATATGLRPGVRYTIRVRAVNALGAGAASLPVVILTGPATVVGRPSVRAGTSAALITWPASSQREVVGYLVTSTSGARCYTYTRTETSCIIGNTAGVRTFYRVFARSAAGLSFGSTATKTVVASWPSVPSRLPGVPGGFRSVSKKVKSGKNASLVARGFLPSSSIVLVAYGKTRHVVKRFTANAAGNFVVTVKMPKDSARSLTFVAFGVTPYASSKAIAALIRRG